jgi:hypothetical protein
LLRIDVVNAAVDLDTKAITDAIGTTGSLSNRLNKSINLDGTLNISAVDNTLHDIAFHKDSSISLTPSQISLIDPLNVYELPSIVPFVRMLQAERDKLMLIANSATALQIEVQSLSNILLFTDQTVQFATSDTITWNIEPAGGGVYKLTANSTGPTPFVAYDNLIPQNSLLDYVNYSVNAFHTAYIDGSLKVYINGVRIFEDGLVYVPSYSVNPVYTKNAFTSSPNDGTFVLHTAITSNDVIRIDFKVTT